MTEMIASESPLESEVLNEVTVIGDVGIALSGTTVLGDVHQGDKNFFNYARAALTPLSADVPSLRRYFVRPEGWDVAVSAFRMHGIVALVGPPGSGRHIAAVNLLAELGVSAPHKILIEPEELPLHLLPEVDVSSENGYIVSLEHLNGRATPEKLDSYRREMLENGPAVLILDESLFQQLPETWAEIRISLQRADPVSIFIHRLREPHSDRAEDWAARPAIHDALERATSSDAVRLAALVAEAHRGEEAPDTDDVISAYHNWEEELEKWFSDTSEVEDRGERRALLLATAALEGLPVASVFAAADLLLSQLKTPPIAGYGLTGPGAAARIGHIEAEVRLGGMRFRRPAFAESVLDRVWLDRPQLRADLRTWLPKLLTTVHGGEAVAVPLITLARRQKDVELIFKAVGQWSAPKQREYAVQALSVAGVSDELGRAVRQALYRWAQQPGTGEGRQLLVVEVCAGPLAEAYPQVALTRLRHLAGSRSALVRSATVDAMLVLAQQPATAATVLPEVHAWITGDHTTRQATGKEVFLRLCTVGETGTIPLLRNPNHLPDAVAVGASWHAVLRDESTRDRATTIAADWLEAVAQEQAPRAFVVSALAGRNGNSASASVLAGAIWEWGRASSSSAVLSRKDIREELFDALMSRRSTRGPDTPPVNSSDDVPEKHPARQPEGDRTHGLV